MNKHFLLAKYFRGIGIAILLVFAGAACLPLGRTSEPMPTTQTDMPTQAVTSASPPLPQDAATDTPLPPATSTPSPTATPTLMPSLPPANLPLPSLTPTAEPPHVTILADSQCMLGPGTDYLMYYPLFALNWMRVIGRNPDGTWLILKALNDPLWKACWIQTDKVRFDEGSLRDVPIVSLVNSYAEVLYQPPTLVRAVRSGNVMTISWQPVYMTEDDARGYLVEAWVCQGGKQVFVPTGLWVSFNQNNNTPEMSLQVTDEPGCDVPSNARLYAVEKHGYTPYREIPWPTFEPQGSSTGTPVFTATPPVPSANSAYPVVALRQYSDCLYGPGGFFLYKTSLPAGALQEVVGRNPDGSWISVEEPGGWDPCWIPVAQARFTPGSLDAVPVTFPTLPISYWYKPPSPTAKRSGDAVTVSWKAIGMAEYDYRGYLVIAWVCQGGQRVYLPVNVTPPYAENTGTLSVTIQDEPGCSQASSAQIYTAEKRGYSGEMIFWPAY
jgi:hypothetical protein